MNICSSWDHPLVAWDGYDNEPCSFCHALKLSDAKDRVIVALKAELAEAELQRAVAQAELAQMNGVPAEIAS